MQKENLLSEQKHTVAVCFTTPNKKNSLEICFSHMLSFCSSILYFVFIKPVTHPWYRKCTCCILKILHRQKDSILTSSCWGALSILPHYKAAPKSICKTHNTFQMSPQKWGMSSLGVSLLSRSRQAHVISYVTAMYAKASCPLHYKSGIKRCCYCSRN